MLLNDIDIEERMNEGTLRVSPFNADDLSQSSIDLHLSCNLAKYVNEPIHLGKSYPKINHFMMSSADGYILRPNEFVLGATVEEVIIPRDCQGWIETKGDIARAGIQIHNCDGHIDPGFQGTITLEIKNNNEVPVVIYPNIAVAQIFFFKMTGGCKNIYSGKYLGQSLPTPYFPK